MKHRKSSITVAALVLSLLLPACAVRRNNPNLTPATVWELNTAHQLQLLERDYRTFFQDVGVARRQGILNDRNVASLNAVGNRLKPAIENSNRLFKTWQISRDESTRIQVINLLLEAQSIWLELVVMKSQILSEGANQ